MDNIKIIEPREDVPEWARQEVTMADKITPNQRKYLLDLVSKKQVAPDQEGTLDRVMKALRISEDPEEFGMSKKQASVLIEWFVGRPNKPVEHSVRIDGDSPLALLPAGRYAIENEQGELRFYQCWQSRDKNVKRLYVIHGPYESKLPYPAQQAIARKIMLKGVRDCAIRYGHEIGSCSNCGRRLTNRISRELGIGPVCGDRMFGDEWSSEVSSARDTIRARGEDPDEELGE